MAVWPVVVATSAKATNTELLLVPGDVVGAAGVAPVGRVSAAAWAGLELSLVSQ